MPTMSLGGYLVFGALVANTLVGPALAWDRKLPRFNGYRFIATDTNQDGGIHMAPDPIDPSNSFDVYRFSISPGPCVFSDCDHQSARATVQPTTDAKQPKEVWYGWDIYFPPDFLINGKQSNGKWLFNEWKDQSCNLASLTLDANLGWPRSYLGDECAFRQGRGWKGKRL